MKRFFILILAAGALVSCKQTFYTGNYGQVNKTQVVISNGDFKVLGSFTGMATTKKKIIGVKNQEGLISQAKADLLKNAKSAGVELTGSRTLINVTFDEIQNSNRITVTLSAEIIEFL